MGSKRLVIGITGGICSGKSTVSAMLRLRGAKVIDADRIAHSLIFPGKPAFGKLIKAFGRGILGRGGRIDRRALADAAFSGKKELALLNAILHPYILGEIRARLRRSTGLTVLDAALLVETGLHRQADFVVFVKASRLLRMERASRRGMDRKRVLRIIAAQAPAVKKERPADFIIDNSGSLDQTRTQVESLRRKVWRN